MITIKISSSMSDDGNLRFGVSAYKYGLGLETSSSVGDVYTSISGSPTLDSYKWYVDNGKLYLQYLYTPKSGYYAGRQQVSDMTVLYGLPGEGELSYIGLHRMAGSIPVTVPDGDLVYPSDDYLVRTPDLPQVDASTGVATWPADVPYTKDVVAVPYPVDEAGEKVGTIPYDVPVDQTTGKDLTDSDTDNPSKPGEGTDTDNPNWPDTGSLSLPKLIASKFPFCIPFDVARLVGLLEAEPKAPVFRIPVVYANIVNEEIVIDFDKFADVLQIIRWGEIMLFVAGLVVITRNYIKW